MKKEPTEWGTKIRALGYGDDMVTFILSAVQAERERIIAELQGICNRCKTERGLARALGNYIRSLKSDV